MHLCVVYMAVLAAIWVQGGEANKCDPKIIASIKAFNKEVPSHILATNFERSPSYAAYTTPGFYGDRKEIRSIVTYWSKEGNLTAHLFYKNGTTEQGQAGPYKERNGVTYDDATMTCRWHIISTGLVDAYYGCQKYGKEGPPNALVKVWKGYEEKDLEKAKENVELLYLRETQPLCNKPQIISIFFFGCSSGQGRIIEIERLLTRMMATYE